MWSYSVSDQILVKGARCKRRWGQWNVWRMPCRVSALVADLRLFVMRNSEFAKFDCASFHQVGGGGNTLCRLSRLNDCRVRGQVVLKGLQVTICIAAALIRKVFWNTGRYLQFNKAHWWLLVRYKLPLAASYWHCLFMNGAEAVYWWAFRWLVQRSIPFSCWVTFLWPLHRWLRAVARVKTGWVDITNSYVIEVFNGACAFCDRFYLSRVCQQSLQWLSLFVFPSRGLVRLHCDSQMTRLGQLLVESLFPDFILLALFLWPNRFSSCFPISYFS